MKDVIFLERNIISTKTVLLHVVGHLYFAFLLKLFNDGQMSVCYILFKFYRDVFKILVDISAVNGFLKILIHLNDFQKSMGMFWVVDSNLTHEHRHMRLKVFICEHQIETV